MEQEKEGLGTSPSAIASPELRSEPQASRPSGRVPTGAKSVADILDAAADLIETLGWTRFDFARDAEGDSIDPRVSRAVCWCALGAILAAGGVAAEADFFAGHLKEKFEAYSISTWNDAAGRTAEEVVSELREAAAIARASVTP